ncbi:hypothetical protein ABPG72_013979 [Tetrahymena utriculariae]
MGNQSCQSNQVQVENYLKSVSRQFDVHKKINQGAQGETIIAKDKVKKKLYAVQSFIFSDELEMEQFIQEMQTFKKLKHQNLIRLKKIQRAEQNQMCSESLLVNLFFEHYERDLLSEFILRSLTKQTLFTLEEITFILQSLVSALAYLQIHKIAYQNLALKSIQITNEGNIKLNEQIFTNQYQKENFPIQLKLNIDQPSVIYKQNQSKVAYFHNRIQIQSQQTKQKNANSKNIYKENVFSLGCLILNLCVNQNVGILSQQNNDLASSEFINQQLSLIEKIYSSDFAQILRKMLFKNDEKRPDFIELAETLGVINKSTKSNIQEYRILNDKSNMSSYSSSVDQKENNQDIFHECQHEPQERNVQNKEQKNNKKLFSIQHKHDAHQSQQSAQNNQTKIIDSCTPGKNLQLQKNEFIKIANQQPSHPQIINQNSSKYQYNYGQIESINQTQNKNYEEQFNIQNDSLQRNQYQINNKFDIGETNKFLIGEQKELEQSTKSVFISTLNNSLIQSVQIADKENTCREKQVQQLNGSQKNQLLERHNCQSDQQNYQKESIIIYESNNNTSFSDKLQGNGSVIIESIDDIRQIYNLQKRDLNKNFKVFEKQYQDEMTKLEKKEQNKSIFPFKNGLLSAHHIQQNMEEEQINQKKCSNFYKEKLQIDKNKRNYNQSQGSSIQQQNKSYFNHQLSEQDNANLNNQSAKQGNNFQNLQPNVMDSDDFQQVQSVAEFYKNDLEGEGVILLQNDFRFYGYFIQGKAQGKCYILDQSDQLIYEGFYQDGVLKSN